jgi:hypothetical protein
MQLISNITKLHCRKSDSQYLPRSTDGNSIFSWALI